MCFFCEREKLLFLIENAWERKKFEFQSTNLHFEHFIFILMMTIIGSGKYIYF